MKALQSTLENGLKVIIVDTKAFPSLTTLLLVGAGSRYEDEKNNGIAHFFEHMAFKGSKKYPTSMILSSTIEGFGGVFNAFTGKDHTGYWIKAPAKHFETVLDVIADMIQRPLLLDEEIQREKGVIIEEINLYEDTPYRKVGEVYERLIYGKHPLGFDIAGSKKTVLEFNRKTFTDYIKDLYHPKNAVLIVAGGISTNGNHKDNKYYLDLIKKQFSGWKNGVKTDFSKVEVSQSKPQILIKNKKTEQAHFCLGFRAYSRIDERKYPLTVLSVILGGGMSSRLFYEVRERRGLCYYISTSRDLYADVGSLVTQAGVAINIEKVKEAIEVTLKEHKKIAKGEVTKNELQKAKELIKGRLILSMEDSATVANWYGKDLLLEDEIKEIKQVIEKVDKVNHSDIVNIASDIFKEQGLNLAVIGPFEDKKAFEDILHI